MADEPGHDGNEGGTGSVDIEAIRQLLDLMHEHGLAELEIEQGDMAVRLRKGGTEAAAAFGAGVPAPAAPAPSGAEPPEEEPLPTINSPMVGTYYSAASPEADAYVQVGDHVDDDTVVCMIEAMKVFNEIRAQTAGTIQKVLVKNGEAIEFDQPLFAVKPD